VALVRTVVSEECIASLIRFERISNLEAAVTVTRNVLQLIVTAYIAPSSPILCTLMMEAIRYSEPSVLTRATQCHITEYGILHSHRSKNLK
jgi:hypothetical protein